MPAAPPRGSLKRRTQLRMGFKQVTSFSRRAELALLAVIFWIFLRVNSERIPVRRRLPAADVSAGGLANSHSVLGKGDGRLARKLRRQKNIARERSSCALVAADVTVLTAENCVSLIFYARFARFGLPFGDA